MAITYPLSMPVDPGGPAKFRITPVAMVGVSTSPFTGEQQVYAHQGQFWQADFTLPPMLRAKAEPWVAFLLSLNGREGTFLMGDSVGRSPRGSVPGTPLVNGGGQSGQVLNTKGWTASQSGILKAGDWIQLGNGAATRLHKVLTDANSDASGLASLDIWPRLRASPADADPLIVSNTVGIWRLSANDMPYDIGAAAIYGMSFSCVEAI